MKKIFISIFLISFTFNFANAEEVKQTKQVKETKKKELSKEDEKLVAEFMKSEKELKDSKELGKTLDEINNKLGVDKKHGLNYGK
jgi:flagellar biosynthesis protein FliP